MEDLQCCVGFCHIAVWISHRYTSEPPSHPSWWSQTPDWAPCVIQQLPTSYLFCIWYCIWYNTPLSILLTFPPSPLCPQACSLPVSLLCAVCCVQSLQSCPPGHLQERIIYHSPHRRCALHPLQEITWGFPGGSVGKNPPASTGNVGSILDPGRSYMPRGSWACAP